VPSLWSAPNLLSFSRIVAAPILYLLIVSGGRYGYLAAAVLFVVASVTDTLDGEMARRGKLVSPFGIYLDTTADKILIAVLLVALGVVH
jgi:CDP-diacylglycerol--glycerol-3-phosphate 3-phosphatidyltransferase